MKKTSSFLFIAVVALLCIPSAEAKECAKIYTDANYSGESWPIKDGESVNWIGDAWNDRVSSFKVSADCALTIYEHARFEGAWQTFSSNVANASDVNWNDYVSSYSCACTAPAAVVEKGPKECASIYTEINHSGEAWTITDGANVEWIGDAWNDRVSSFKVSRGCSLTVYEHARFEGAWETFTSSIANASDRGWNDYISGYTCTCQ